MNEVQKALIKISQQLNANYTLNERSLVYDEVFSDVGLLPGLARRADQLCMLVLNYGIGVTYEEHEGAILKKKVMFDDTTPNVIRVMCLTDVICELVSLAPSRASTPLDELLYEHLDN